MSERKREYQQRGKKMKGSGEMHTEKIPHSENTVKSNV